MGYKFEDAIDWAGLALCAVADAAADLIQDLGGWSSMVALQRYLDVSEEEKMDAIRQL